VWINKIASGREAELAERMGVDRAYVSGLELGQRNPTIVTLWHLVEAHRPCMDREKRTDIRVVKFLECNKIWNVARDDSATGTRGYKT
jgi:transcriptional regulator with XRE-family HTH domain